MASIVSNFEISLQFISSILSKVKCPSYNIVMNKIMGNIKILSLEASKYISHISFVLVYQINCKCNSLWKLVIK